MARVVGKTITGGPHKLDGNTYVDCVFQNAEFEFWGGDPPIFINCAGGDNHFAFVNQAANTISCVEAISAMHGDRSFLEDTFPGIFKPS